MTYFAHLKVQTLSLLFVVVAYFLGYQVGRLLFSGVDCPFSWMMISVFCLSYIFVGAFLKYKKFV